MQPAIPVAPPQPTWKNKARNFLTRMKPPSYYEMFPPTKVGLGAGNKLGNNGQHNPRREIWAMLILALLGLTLGILIDLLFGNILRSKRFAGKRIRFFMAFVQLLTLIFTTYGLYWAAGRYGFESFVGTFQGTYPGMMFGIFFYGTQNNMFDGFKGVAGNVMG